MKRFQFWRLYIPTGERTRGEMDAHNAQRFLFELNAYNRSAPGQWQYWADAADTEGRPV